MIYYCNAQGIAHVGPMMVPSVWYCRRPISHASQPGSAHEFGPTRTTPEPEQCDSVMTHDNIGYQCDQFEQHDDEHTRGTYRWPNPICDDHF